MTTPESHLGIDRTQETDRTHETDLIQETRDADQDQQAVAEGRGLIHAHTPETGKGAETIGTGTPDEVDQEVTHLVKKHESVFTVKKLVTLLEIATRVRESKVRPRNDHGNSFSCYLYINHAFFFVNNLLTINTIPY